MIHDHAHSLSTSLRLASMSYGGKVSDIVESSFLIDEWTYANQ